MALLLDIVLPAEALNGEKLNRGLNK